MKSSSVCLGMFFILLSGYNVVIAQTLIKDSCMKSKGFPRFNTHYCIKYLQENPETRAAKTLRQLIRASVRLAQRRITTAKGMFQKIPKEGEYPPQNCFKIYTRVSETLNKGMALIAAGKPRTAAVTMEPTLRASSDCSAGIKFENMTPQIQAELAVLQRLVQIPVSFSNLL